MAVTKFLARDLTIEIADAGSGGGYIEIKGVNSLTHSPSSSDAETSDFESSGFSEHLKAERGDSWTISGFALEDVVTGDRDPGQALVEALSRIVGPLAIGTFRVTSPGGNTITFNASAEVTLEGGGTNDASTWQAVLRVSGAMVFA